MVGKASEYGNLVPRVSPMPREFRGATGGSAHLGREVLGDVEKIHET